MDDIRKRMQQAVGRGEAPPGAREEVERRAIQLGRGRRMRAMALSLCVCLVGGLVFWQAWTRGQSNSAASPGQSGGSPGRMTRYSERQVIDVAGPGEVNDLVWADGSIWVAGGSPTGGFVARVDPASGNVTRIPSVAGTSLSVNSQGIWVTGQASTAGLGEGWRLQLIDPTRNEVTKTFKLDFQNGGVAIAATDDWIWVGVADGPDGESAHLDRVDPTSGVETRLVSLPAGVPRALFVQDGDVWVSQMILHDGAYQGQDVLSRVDPTMATVQATFENPAMATPGGDLGIWGVEFQPQGSSALVSLDTSSGASVVYSDLPQPNGTPLAVSMGVVWYGSSSGLVAFDVANDEVQVLDPGDDIVGLTPNPGGGVWALGFGGAAYEIGQQ